MMMLNPSLLVRRLRYRLSTGRHGRIGRHASLCLLGGVLVTLIWVLYTTVYQTHVNNVTANVSTSSKLTIIDSLYVLDWTASRNIFSENQEIYCGDGKIVKWTKDRGHLKTVDLVSFHVHQSPTTLPDLLENQYSMVYVLESEQNSPHSTIWSQCDFRMWYNLDKSYPAPATYFDLHLYLSYLLTPISNHPRSGIAWMISNCKASNHRQELVEQLMKYVHVDFLGACLRNVNDTFPKNSGKNADIYRRYKFVIAIENSNCEDYVTEKFIQVIEAQSIPIVASAKGRPDYDRFAPRHSYVNALDFKTVKDLADHLVKAMGDDDLYASYNWYRSKNVSFVEEWLLKDAKELIEWSRTEQFKDEPFASQLLSKETSVNKYCKVLDYLSTHSRDVIRRQRAERPTARDVCLNTDYFQRHFDY